MTSYLEVSNFQVRFRILDGEFILQPGQVLPLRTRYLNVSKFEIEVRTAAKVINSFLISNAKNKKLSSHPTLSDLTDDFLSELAYPGGLRYLTPSNFKTGLSASSSEFLYSPLLARTFINFTSGFKTQIDSFPFELVVCAASAPEGAHVVPAFNVYTGRVGNYYAVPLPIILSECFDVVINEAQQEVLKDAIDSYLESNGCVELGLYYNSCSMPISQVRSDQLVKVNFAKTSEKIRRVSQPVMDHDLDYRLRLFSMGRFNPSLL
jgi:hypothetical protein